jgi:hypothetical protein
MTSEKEGKNPGDLIVLFDSTDSVIGFVIGAKIYDDKGVFVMEVNPTATIKHIRDVLLNRKARGSVV